MKNKFRKYLALLLTVLMLASCMPVDALAAIVPVSGGTQTSSSISLRSIVRPPVATATYIFMNGDTEFDRQILKNGDTLNNPGTPAAADSSNKEFVGWLADDGSAPAFGKVTVTETTETTYHAQFADVYFVFFTNPNGEVMVTKKGYKGDTISTEGVTYPVGNEESIVGWEDASGNLVSSVTLNGSDVTLKARVEQGHWITFDSQGGTYVAPAFVKGNGTTTAPAAPTRPGYTFKHWSETVDGSAFTFGNALTTALTLYAVWTPNTRTQYTVIHWWENANDDGYTYHESETKTGITGELTAAAGKTYNITGKNVLGQNVTDQVFTAQTIEQQKIAGDGSTIVNVYYSRKSYTITFRASNWSGYTTLKTLTKKWGASLQTSDWYTYNGDNNYEINGNTRMIAFLSTMPMNGATLNAKGNEGSTNTATYYGEALSSSQSGAIQVSGRWFVVHHTDTTKGTSNYTVGDEDRYPIEGFTLISDMGTQVGDKYKNAKFYYSRNFYNVVYINNGAEKHTAPYLYQANIVNAGDYTLDPTDAPAGKEDYVFDGWYDAPTGGNKFNFNREMPAQNVTVYAHWVKPTVTGKAHITVDGTGASEALTATYGEALNAEELNTLQNEIMTAHQGYTWRGWRTGPNGTGEPFNVDTKIYSDITLYPYYTKDGTFKVEYVAVKDDVTAPVDGKSYVEDSFADLKAPGKLVADDGEYFLGWSDGAATYQPRDKYQIKSNHADEQNVITLTAQWGARPATVSLTYKANGGTGKDVVENLANNATVTTRPGTTFSRDGYTFKGWDTDPKGKGSIAPNTQVQVDNNDGENVLYAIWTANANTKYTVEFYYQNQNVDGTYTLNHSDERTATTDTEVSVTDADKAAKENNKYVFEADNKNNVLSGNVAGDGSLVLKLYFKLNTASYTIHHYLNGTTVKVAEDQTGTKTIGETLTANKSDALYLAYAAAVVAGYAPSQTIKIAADESKNVITVYYTMPLTITAEDANKTYDGQPLTQPDFKMEGLVNGDTKDSFSLSMTAASTITNAGSTPNVIDTDTVKYKGGEIPSYYKVSYKPGTLTVNKASVTVTITGVNETAVYDGRQHEANGYNYSFTGKPGQITISLKPNVLAIARRTDVGTTYMGLTKDSFTVTSANYDVTIKAVIDGYVTITPVTDKVTVTVTENGDIVTYDGKEHSVTGYESMTADNVLYDVKTSVSETVTAAWTAKGTEAGEYPVGVAAGDFENINKNFTNVEFVIVDGVLKINPVTDKVTVTVTENSATYTYDGTEHSVTGYASMTADNVLYDVETSVTETATAAWTAKGTNVGEYPVGIVARDFVNTNKNFTNVEFVIVDGALTINPITDKVTVTITENSATYTYDGTEHSVYGHKSMTADNELYDVDTSVTATPTEAWTAKGTNAGTYNVGIEAGDFVNTNKNFTNVEFVVVDGVLKITKATLKVTFTGESDTRVYNGSEQRLTGIEADGLLTGHKYEGLTYLASGTDAGEYTGKFTGTVKITDAAGVDVTENYIVEQEEGKLVINPITEKVTVTVTENSATVTYDGAEHSVYGYKSMAANNALYTIKGSVEETPTEAWTAKGTNAGEYPVGIKAGDFKNINENFADVEFVIVDGALKINPISAKVTVTITENSATYTYDGTEHSVSGYESMTADNVLYDVETSVTETATEAWTAKGTNAGRYEVGIKAGDFKNISKNFTNVEFVIVDGTLVINPITEKVTVTVTENSDTVTYNGTEHSVTGYESMTADNKLYDVKTSVTETPTEAWTAKGTNAGTYEVGIVAGDFKNINGNFTNVEFVIVDGALKITEANIKDYVTLDTADVTKTYDGDPHATGTATAEDANNNELKIEYSVDGKTWTEAPSTITATDVADSKTVNVRVSSANYDGYVEGTQELTITKRKVTLTSATDGKSYDGTPLTNHEVTVGGDGFAKGEGASYDVTGTITNVGSVDNTFTYTLNENTNADNYEITKYEGKLTVTGDKIIPEKTTPNVESNYKLGDTIPFTITVKNVSTEPVENITVEDQMAIIVAGTGYTVSADGHTATIASLASGAQVEIKAEHVVTEKDILAGTVGNTATVKWDNTERNVTAKSDDIEKPNSALKVVKETTSEPKNGKTYALGEEIKYTITVTNTGNLTTTDIEVTDSLSTNEGKVIGTIASLAPDESKTFNFTYTVTEQDILNGKVLNSAAAKGNTPDGNKPEGEGEKEDDTDDIDTTLEVVKTSNKKPDETAKLGEVILYTITVKNNGNVTYYNVKVDDELTGLHETIAKLGVGDSKKFTTEWTVTEEDILNGKVLNVATAKGDKVPDPKDPENPKTPEGEGKKEDDTEEKKSSFNVEKKLTNLPEKKYFTLGETAEFNITVTNDGNLTLTDLTVTEQLSGAKYAESNAYTVNGADAIIAELKPGEQVVIKASYTITEDDLGNKDLKNVVTGKGKGPDGKDPEGGDEEEVPTDDAISVSGSKTWDDQDNRFEVRPETITLRLHADGAEYKTAEIGADQNWTYKFSKLPKHTKSGAEIVYTVTEDAVVGYETTTVETDSGVNFTNTLRQCTLHIDYTYIRHKGGTPHEAFPPVDMVLYYGQDYSVKSPKLWGFVPNIHKVEGVITEDTVVHVLYSGLDYTLTIEYVYEDGTTAAPTHTEVLKIYDRYGVASPKIPGYVPTWEFVAGSMYAHDEYYRIVYRAIKPQGVGNITLNLGDCFE